MPDLPINAITTINLQNGLCGANIHLINSCWGCGEVEHIPEPFRDSIFQAIEATLIGPNSDAAKKYYYERQLDTPAISETTLKQTVQTIANAPSHFLPIIVAHHNLLPQRIPRLDPYTDLVNSGALRSSLLDLKRPILYLHGHIHDETIEIVRSTSSAPFIVISAPEALKGFNILDILYTSNSTPLALHLIPYRFDGSGILRKDSVVRIPLSSNRRHSTPASLHMIFTFILDRREIYWSALQNFCSSIRPVPTDEQLAEVIEILHADGSIVVENHDLRPIEWIVRVNV